MVGARLIEVPAWGNVTLIEALWLSSGIFAVLFTMLHIRPLYDDYVGARLSGREELMLVATGYLRREVIRLLQGLCLTTIGVYAAVQPSPLGRNVVTVTGLVLTGVLLTLAVLVTVQSVWDWRTRHHVQRLIDNNGNGPKEDK